MGRGVPLCTPPQDEDLQLSDVQAPSADMQLADIIRLVVIECVALVGLGEPVQPDLRFSKFVDISQRKLPQWRRKGSQDAAEACPFRLRVLIHSR